MSIYQDIIREMFGQAKLALVTYAVKAKTSGFAGLDCASYKSLFGAYPYISQLILTSNYHEKCPLDDF